MIPIRVAGVQASGGSGWSAGLGSNLGWALSSFGGAKAKGRIHILHYVGLQALQAPLPPLTVCALLSTPAALAPAMANNNSTMMQ